MLEKLPGSALPVEIIGRLLIGLDQFLRKRNQAGCDCAGATLVRQADGMLAPARRVREDVKRRFWKNRPELL